MVLEIALLEARPGAPAQLAAAYAQARPLVADSSGCRSVRLTQGIETPTRFVLLVEWDSVEAHEAFRGSDRFPKWRALIGPHCAGPPQVEHFADV